MLYGGSPQRCNYRPHNISPPLQNRWIYKASSAVSKSLLAVGNYVLFTTLDGEIDAVNVNTGEKVGRKKLPKHRAATCAVQNHRLVVASRHGDKTLALYDLQDGKTVWEINAGDIESEPLIAGDAVYISALYNHIDKYKLETGEKIWTYQTTDQLRSSPALLHEIIVTGSDDGTIYALSAEKGELIWKYKTGSAVMATPVLWEDQVFAGSLDSTFYAFDLKDGHLLWTFKTEHPLYQTAATDGEFVAFGSSDGQFYCLKTQSGQLIWKFQAKSVVSTSPLMTENMVYFGSLDHYYYGLNKNTGEKVWSYQTKGRIRTAPILWKSFILGASENKFVYAFRQVSRN